MKIMLLQRIEPFLNNNLVRLYTSFRDAIRYFIAAFQRIHFSIVFKDNTFTIHIKIKD